MSPDPSPGPDPDLADRLRAAIGDEPGLTERHLFGSLAFLVHGNLAVSAGRDGDLMVRTDPSRTEQLLREPGAHPFEMSGRSMRGWLGIDGDAVASEEDLARWAEVGVSYARRLPPKRG